MSLDRIIAQQGLRFQKLPAGAGKAFGRGGRPECTGKYPHSFQSDFTLDRQQKYFEIASDPLIGYPIRKEVYVDKSRAKKPWRTHQRTIQHGLTFLYSANKIVRYLHLP